MQLAIGSHRVSLPKFQKKINTDNLVPVFYLQYLIKTLMFS